MGRCNSEAEHSVSHTKDLLVEPLLPSPLLWLTLVGRRHPLGGVREPIIVSLSSMSSFGSVELLAPVPDSTRFATPGAFVVVIESTVMAS